MQHVLGQVQCAMTRKKEKKRKEKGAESPTRRVEDMYAYMTKTADFRTLNLGRVSSRVVLHFQAPGYLTSGGRGGWQTHSPALPALHRDREASHKPPSESKGGNSCVDFLAYECITRNRHVSV